MVGWTKLLEAMFLIYCDDVATLFVEILLLQKNYFPVNAKSFSCFLGFFLINLDSGTNYWKQYTQVFKPPKLLLVDSHF